MRDLLLVASVEGLSLVFGPAIAAAAVTALGVRSARGKFVGPSLAISIALGLGFGFLVAISGRDDDVTDDRFLEGLLLASAICVVSAFGYYLLGRGLARRPVALGVAFGVTLVALYPSLFLGWIYVSDLVACTEDQYECPL